MTTSGHFAVGGNKFSRMLEALGAKERQEPKTSRPVTLRKFSWEKDT